MTEPTQRAVKRYGWLPDLPDRRDHRFAASSSVLAKLPTRVDLREQCPETVYDQGKLGSCTANAIAAAYEFDLIKQSLPRLTPSRLFIYYNERVIGGNVECDSGAMIRDGIKSVTKQGVCAEELWPYQVEKFAEKPSQSCYDKALDSRAVGYQRVHRDLDQFKGALAQGYPIIFGFRVYEQFEGAEVAKTGQLEMPAAKERALGGHAVLAVGYDDATQRFTIRNSWGPGWGDRGHFTMPYGYITHRGLASDFWTILQVT